MGKCPRVEQEPSRVRIVYYHDSEWCPMREYKSHFLPDGSLKQSADDMFSYKDLSDIFGKENSKRMYQNLMKEGNRHCFRVYRRGTPVEVTCFKKEDLVRMIDKMENDKRVDLFYKGIRLVLKEHYTLEEKIAV